MRDYGISWKGDYLTSRRILNTALLCSGNTLLSRSMDDAREDTPGIATLGDIPAWVRDGAGLGASFSFSFSSSSVNSGSVLRLNESN